MTELDFTGLQVTCEETGEKAALEKDLMTTCSFIMEDAQLSLPAIMCVADNSRDLSTLPEPLKALAKVYYKAFAQGAIGADGIFHSPLNTIADIFRNIGLQGQYLVAALISVLTMVSAKLGFPGALIIVDEVSDANALVSLAEKFIPENLVFRATELDDKALFRSSKELSGRVIVNDNLSGLKKSQTYIEGLIEMGHTVMQIPQSSFNGGKRNEQVEINGPTSLIAVANNPEKADFKCSTLMKIVFDAEDSAGLIDRDAFADKELHLEARAFAKAFKRMVRCSVDIPFKEQIEEFARQHRISQRILVPLINMVSVLTVINQTEPPSPKELMESYLGAEVPLARRNMTATKLEYYTAYTLMGGCIGNGDGLNVRQMRIFDAIKAHNLKVLSESTIADMNDFRDILKTLPYNENTWIAENDILDALNRDGGNVVKDGVLRIELKKLQGMGVICQDKKSNKKNQHGFYILKPHVGNLIPLPAPWEIIDRQVYQGKDLRAVNPITGEVEVIQSCKDTTQIEGKPK
jgi:hypothetical protein